MDGINLSQSMQEGSRKGSEKTAAAFLDKGMTGASILFFITAAIWGGLVWYVGTIDQKIASVSQELALGTASLAGKEADRAGDFYDRSSIIKKSLSVAVDPSIELGQMEKVMVPDAILVGYRYDREEGRVSIIGTTDSFKHVAEQLLSLKMSGDFGTPKMASLSRLKDGKIEFAIDAEPSAAVLASEPLE